GMRDEEGRRPICSARGRFRRSMLAPVGTHRWCVRHLARRGLWRPASGAALPRIPRARLAARGPRSDLRRGPATAPVLATVRLVNAVFYAHHGVMEEEHRIGGRFEVDVAMDLDVTEAAQTDDLGATVDYEQVYRLAKEVVMGNSSYLIERLAHRIGTAVLEASPRVERVEVTVRKPNPPVKGPVERAEVTVRLAR
ncbi:MAG: dihydroneopterin aldolase, partial [Bacteroidota bacterium]